MMNPEFLAASDSVAVAKTATPAAPKAGAAKVIDVDRGELYHERIGNFFMVAH